MGENGTYITGEGELSAVCAHVHPEVVLGLKLLTTFSALMQG